jgi:hypothetical protein
MCAACGVPTHVAVLDPDTAVVGLRPALGWSATALCACVAVMGLYLALAARRPPAPDPDRAHAPDLA